MQKEEKISILLIRKTKLYICRLTIFEKNKNKTTTVE